MVWLPGQIMSTCSSRHLPVWVDIATATGGGAAVGGCDSNSKLARVGLSGYSKARTAKVTSLCLVGAVRALRMMQRIRGA